jgi:hypothetical protein
MTNHLAVIDQRLQNRRSNIPFLCPYQLGIKQGKRIARRRSEPGEAYVDRYGWAVVSCCLAIVLLSATDAFLTLNILANGGMELNSLMAALIEESTQKFVYSKLALTSLATIILVIHHEVRIVTTLRCRHLLYLIALGYACLIGYELILLQFIAI